jgi:uncharacterized membrane protein YfcA
MTAMGLLMSIEPLYSLSGFFVGLLVGQTGVGGGSLMTPLLVLLFGVHPSTAVGTDLLFAAATKGVGTLVHGAHGSVDWRITGWLATGSVPAAVLTMLALAWFRSSEPAAGHVIAVILGVALVLTAIALLLRNRILSYAMGRSEMDPRRTAALTVATGAVLGVLVSISSVSAGAIGVTALILLYPRRGILTIIGSDIAHAVPLTLIAGLGHWMTGEANMQMLVSLLSGSIPGVVLGSVVSAWVPEWVLRPVLAMTLLVVGMTLVI